MAIPGGIKAYVAKNKLAYEDSKKRMMQHFERSYSLKSKCSKEKLKNKEN